MPGSIFGVLILYFYFQYNASISTLRMRLALFACFVVWSVRKSTSSHICRTQNNSQQWSYEICTVTPPVLENQWQSVIHTWNRYIGDLRWIPTLSNGWNQWPWLLVDTSINVFMGNMSCLCHPDSTHCEQDPNHSISGSIRSCKFLLFHCWRKTREEQLQNEWLEIWPATFLLWAGRFNHWYINHKSSQIL